MIQRLPTTCFLLLAIAAPVPVAAQQSPVTLTFEVPVNLTRLPASINVVRVSCLLQSQGLSRGANYIGGTPTRTAGTDVTVTGGAVSRAVVEVVMTLDPSDLQNPSGKQAAYECDLLVREPSPRAPWMPFRDAQSRGYPDLVLTPAPAKLTGQFVW